LSLDSDVHVAAEEERQTEVKEAPAKRSGHLVENLVAGGDEPARRDRAPASASETRRGQGLDESLCDDLNPIAGAR
jgi:hypothetical protein